MEKTCRLVHITYRENNSGPSRRSITVGIGLGLGIRLGLGIGLGIGLGVGIGVGAWLGSA